MKAAMLVLRFAVILVVVAGLVSAQSVISAKPGMINHTDGKVFLDGKEVRAKSGLFPNMKVNEELKTEDSRVEVLLNPGVILRAGENTSVKMLSDRLVDNRVELLHGSIIVECSAMAKGDVITLIHKDATISLVKNGVYRLDSEPAQLRVYDGEARVEQAGQAQVVKKARLLPLNGVSVAEKFDNKTGDALYRWARLRGEYLAMANPSAARGLRNVGVNSWVYNPYYGAFTFVPYRGIWRSFWGYQYWSPGQVYMFYNPPYYAGSGYGGGSSPSGYTGMPATSSGTSGTVASAPTASTPSGSTSVSVPHQGGGGGVRR
jgi:hypothetical protein